MPGCYAGFGCGVVFKLSPGGTETVLYSFCSLSGCRDGAEPTAGLIADSAGNQGTTQVGGASDHGAVFKLSPGGAETVLYSFCSVPSCSDGSGPDAGLIADSAGNLYGTTGDGGVPGCYAGFGCGVVFKLSPGGTETVLYSFCSQTSCSDGANPQAGLIADSAGNLYATTYVGGVPGCYGSGCGVVFKLSPGGAETVLYSFCSKPGCSEGGNPQAGLIADSAGNFYGTTFNGGAAGGSGGALGNGVVFKLSPGGTETVLYSFCSLSGCRDGAEPTAGLIADSAGNLYGTTNGGGASGWAGAVFKLAGTGFVTATPFLAFSAALTIDIGGPPPEDTFNLHSSFTLSSTAPGIDPPTEPVTL